MYKTPIMFRKNSDFFKIYDLNNNNTNKWVRDHINSHLQDLLFVSNDTNKINEIIFKINDKIREFFGYDYPIYDDITLLWYFDDVLDYLLQFSSITNDDIKNRYIYNKHYLFIYDDFFKRDIK